MRGIIKGVTRRHLLRNVAGASAGLALPWGARTPSANAAAGPNLKKYVQKVPLPGARDRGCDRIIYRVQASRDQTATAS